ncbi:undecaprenyl-diphosphatase [Peribacillus simplex]|uniref:undecaprenyl-diphosphatase n=1 Tax=Peribacillus simplex TaxID=1478 RepID=UPI000BA5B96A|nr:undecaprenyl-diphosphatase [Peribacillus simplex]PAK37496.1 undecaprenyl-diphosphatase [Peribacillus simplex]PRS23512.1 undecaprenyl-diphosphatase [Bacillus sp. RJGP41]
MALSEMNSNLFRMINNLGKQYTDLNPFFVFIAEYMIFFLVLAVLMFLFSRNNKNRIMVFCAFIALVISEILAKIAGQFHSNYQPFAELPNVNKLVEKAVNNSFPSDHTIIFFSFCITFWLFKRGWGFLWGILAVLVGISRIWVGVHYPADVLVGAIISIVSAMIVYKIVLKLSLTKKFLRNQGVGEQSILSALSKQKKGQSKDY